jgi:hypothetical protein
MNDQAEPVLAAALERLIQNGTLTREQANAVRTDFHADLGTSLQSAAADRPREQQNNSWTPVLAEVGGYVGAAFVFAAAVALVGPGWDNFTQAVRVALLAGPAVLLLIAAVAVAVSLPGGWSFRRPTAGPQAGDDQGVEGHGAAEHPASAATRRLIGALVLAAGALLAGATAVITHDTGFDRWVPLAALIVWWVGYLLCRGVPLHLGTAAALTCTVLTVFDPDFHNRFPLSGLLLVFAAAGWALLAKLRLVEEQALAIAVAGVMAFVGGEIVATSDYEGLGYLLLGLLSVLGLVGYIRTRELSALGVGAGTLAVVVPQVVIDYTEGSLGAAGGLLVSGLSVVAVSVLAARLRHSGSGPTQVV